MTKKVAAKKVVKKTLKKLKPHEQVVESLIELIRMTSTVVPDDVAKTLLAARKKEAANTSASYAMDIIKDNIELAKIKSQPLCQDTGTVIFYIYHPPGFHQAPFKDAIKKAVVKATQKGTEERFRSSPQLRRCIPQSDTR